VHKCRYWCQCKSGVLDKFCYLGDMLSVDGDADAAVENRIRMGWNKFRQLVPLLTNKDISLKVRGVSEQFLNGTSAHNRLFSAIESEREIIQ